jgi:uncharacterized protein (DUF58 family)
VPRSARLVLVGDFLQPLEAIDGALRPYVDRGVMGELVQVHDPAELDLPFAGRVRFNSAETEGPLQTTINRVEDIRDAYRRRLADHHDGLADLARSYGWGHLVHRTDRAPEAVLMALYRHLSERADVTA